MKWVLVLLMLNPNPNFGNQWIEAQRIPGLLEERECNMQALVLNSNSRDPSIRGGRIKFECDQALETELHFALYSDIHRRIVMCMTRKGEDAAVNLRLSGRESPLAYIWRYMQARLSLREDGSLRLPPVITVIKPWSIISPIEFGPGGRMVERMEERPEFASMAMAHTASIIEACQPFLFPKEKFERWKELIVDLSYDGSTKAAR